ncbi:hypothetical protein AAFF_G00319040 [Aldrovandia affinis]|uniref:SH2 domain-containing protein 4A n=1 Tax=Aldrovandia affinis TaxID=143900 RepID=A0AAD7WQ90_9TELE|nr:hypothetical protein AAFF_G00319040 [Aldrovandia affinis]
MLQQILKDMYIDPDVLEALNEEQKKILFLKMRQEQVRRWKEREEKLEREGNTALKPKPEKARSKNVSWLLGRDGDVQVCMIGEVDEFRSKFIYSELGQMKGSNLQSNTRHQTDAARSSLVNRGGSEPEDLPSQTPPGIQLHFKGIQPTSEPVQQPPPSQENSEELKPGSHLPPLQVSKPEPQSSSTVEQEEACNTSTAIDTLRDSGLYYRSHRKCRTGSIADKLHPLDTQDAAPLSGADRHRLHPQEPKAQEQSKGKEFQPVPATQRAETEGSGPKGTGCTGDRDPTMARGRVAQLMKTFSAPSLKRDTPSRPKPPIPAKPSHLQLLASPSHR